jgi:hypothetical protein
LPENYGKTTFTVRALLVAALASVCLGLGACGKVGPPQPPLTRTPVRPNQLAAAQVGSAVRLTWSAPRLDLRPSEPSSVRRADVYRLRQTRDATPFVVPDDFEGQADIVGFIDYDSLKKQLGSDDKLTYEDRLDLSQPAVLANARFQYAVRYVDGRGRPQAFSNIVSLEPVPGIAKPPTGLAVAQAQDQVTVTWTPPAENIDGSVPAQVAGYNIYRVSPKAERLGRPLNDRLLTDPRYVDRNFLYNTPYIYVIRSVSQAPDQIVESSDSERLAVTPKDTFPPAAPTNVTVASASGVVSLFWPSNAESDVVGYYVYRIEGEPSPTAKWTRITDSPVTRTTYRDERVRTGTRYSYRITAVDRFGNQSQPSEPSTETASP